MNANQYMTALSLSTQAALKSGQITLPEIMGCLELTKLNVDRMAYQHALERQAKENQIVASSILPPPPARG